VTKVATAVKRREVGQMELLLNASDHDAAALSQIASWGFSGTRCDVQPGADVESIAQGFSGAPIRPLFLIHDLNQPAIVPVACSILGPDGFDVELTNEPDLSPEWHESPVGWAQQVRATAEWIRGVGFEGTVMSGGISNLNRRGFDYLRHAIELLPYDITVAIHRYPDGACDPRVPYPPAESRREEIEYLIETVGTRKIAHTEGGYHQAERDVKWHHDMSPLTDVEVATRVRYELALFQEYGFKTFTHYQRVDGPGDGPIDHYGLLRVDGSVKDAIVSVFQNWRTP
jgi:hypothetical protein